MRMLGIFISIDTAFWETSDVETQKYQQKPFLRYKHEDLRSSNHNKTSTSIMIKSFLSVESYFLFSSFAKLKIYVFLKGSVFNYKASPFNKTCYIKYMHGRGAFRFTDQWISGSNFSFSFISLVEALTPLLQRLQLLNSFTCAQNFTQRCLRTEPFLMTVRSFIV